MLDLQMLKNDFDLQELYKSMSRLDVVENTIDALSETTQDAISLLRYARFKLLKAGMYEDQFLSLDFANTMIAAGVLPGIATQIEVCFSDFFDFDGYIGAIALEKLELTLIRNEIMQEMQRA